MYKLFVLDFDETYDLERHDSSGVAPFVYLIRKKDSKLAVSIAKKAHDAFHDDEESDMGIGDFFEQFMEEQKAFCKGIGEIDIPFGERVGRYLADKIGFAAV